MIIDNELFWKEVRLLAINNYGNWTNETEARDRIDQAVEDVFESLKDSIETVGYKATDYNSILKEMRENYESEVNND